MSFHDGESEDDNDKPEYALPAPETATQVPVEVQNDPASSERLEEADDHREKDFHPEQEFEVSNQTTLNATDDGNAGAEFVGVPTYSGELVERMGESFRHVANECEPVIPSTEHDTEASDTINRTITMSVRMSKHGEVQNAVKKLAAADSSFMRRADVLGEDMMALRAREGRNGAEADGDDLDAAEIDLDELDLDDTDDVAENIVTTEEKEGKRSDGGAPVATPWYKRFLRALKKLCQNLRKLGVQAIELVVGKIMACFNVAKAIARRIFRAVRTGLLWIRKAIVDPQGQIREILDNPEKSNCEKALGVIGVVSTAIIGALIIAFGVDEDAPFGVGAAAVSAAAAASVAVRKASARDRGHH